jgi:hypothetical protein
MKVVSVTTTDFSISENTARFKSHLNGIMKIIVFVTFLSYEHPIKTRFWRINPLTHAYSFVSPGLYKSNAVMCWKLLRSADQSVRHKTHSVDKKYSLQVFVELGFHKHFSVT